MKQISLSPEQTKCFGEKLAKEAKPNSKARVYCLRGELGAGKTCFLQGFGKGLNIKEKIQSPTFIIMSRFPLRNQKFNNFYHLDCYRIEEPEEILKLDFEEIINNPQNIVAIEWPEKIEQFLPKERTDIVLKILDENKREINIKNYKK
ncbi:MAG TPA: tRNA (adenosine(37)-N6)-threonylcarbamoyltransferase complex ATPase subunit type 1 TsaE [Candidatus Pacearchaeota archaeon]|jgi:tRNA threonylcarbamoyladenosine biosynthesis protein TsaE|nr:tRNA (adenosine(37)-N6)-threonylcarbamoyltransferase complex ATPase subunit type 1 TsaE [Candidatus Pacearchaeota archaeon]HRR94838.1 tRNA (adenosine(37)-N6)-threonylcarbamoyltransferase complex ATPase subunit type 1 TsaE [Candidatus Paceibacterota bacterium]HPC30613.1 tRNA (adenosine(37)-N6)-threonylcarbamoyltransferase complex ATPase subunit type 1 TsaE [Candidatus Pacearchaeota archaeon]HQG09357.1 tRNA (adenosine(37)-N6)-threonylcarbamoyltransferase complex ATPase subunit type 1 TsaE [Cand